MKYEILSSSVKRFSLNSKRFLLHIRNMHVSKIHHVLLIHFSLNSRVKSIHEWCEIFGYSIILIIMANKICAREFEYRRAQRGINVKLFEEYKSVRGLIDKKLINYVELKKVQIFHEMEVLE